MVSKASEDLPEPDSPVITTRLSRGRSTSMFLRLCSRAPRMRICCCMADRWGPENAPARLARAGGRRHRRAVRNVDAVGGGRIRCRIRQEAGVHPAGSSGGGTVMAEQTSESLLAMFDAAPLNRRYWMIFILMSAVFVFAFFPEGAWWLFAILRFFVGVGLTAAVTPSLTVVVELTPTRYRTFATSFYVVWASAGGFLAPAVSAAIMGPYGWRRVALLGFVALIIGVLVWIFTPESVRWQTAKGRFAEARAAGARYLRLPLERVPLPTVPPVQQPRGNWLDLLSQPRMFFETILIWGGSSTAAYGVYLWGPTIVALLLNIPVPQAAAYFVIVSGAGVTGKIVVTVVAPLIGRRLLGIIWGFGGTAALALAGYYNTVMIGEIPLMVVLLACSTFCIEGGFSNLAPYTVESYGVNLGARSSGLGQTANGFGKIIGPLSLALIAGTSHLVSMQQTEAAVFPAFLFLAFAMLLVGLSFLFLGVETHGKQMVLGHDPAR